MTVNRRVYKLSRFVPVKFARFPGAVPAGTFAPDPDDRGYSTFHGPVVGVCRTDNTRIRITREMLDDNAPLYVTSEDNAKVSITTPAAGTTLANGHHAHIDFRAGATDGDCKIQVRAQAANGPIVGELTVHVSNAIEVDCAVHRTAIYNLPGARSAANTTTRTFAQLTAIMTEVNRQWRPAGISFNVDTQRNNTNLTNQVARNGVNPVDGVLLCPVFGSGIANENFNRIMNTNTVADRLNLYFVRSIQAAHTGPGAAPNYIGFGSAFHRGMVVADNIGDVETTAHTVSHELGHILNLAGRSHADPHDSHSDDDPQWRADVGRRRHDLWSRRRLMYFQVGLTATERSSYSFGGTDVGHGAGRSGHMITIKSLTQDPTDNEYTDARAQAATL